MTPTFFGWHSDVTPHAPASAPPRSIDDARWQADPASRRTRLGR
jgi:hypothetical protein